MATAFLKILKVSVAMDSQKTVKAKSLKLENSELKRAVDDSEDIIYALKNQVTELDSMLMQHNDRVLYLETKL
jgi:predicted RNase H-like nuclease (RuvC/YqgF family)